ncbi:MAG: DUF6468 domain-containing protein [Sphingomonadales bacterium]
MASFVSVSMLVDLGLASLLTVVIVLALRLDKRLKTVRDSSGELRTLISGLNDATERAHQAVAQMSAAAKEHEATLGISIAKARDLSDELSIITQSAESMANRLAGEAPSKPVRVDPKPAPAVAPLPGSEDIDANEKDALRKLLAGVR